MGYSDRNRRARSAGEQRSRYLARSKPPAERGRRRTARRRRTSRRDGRTHRRRAQAASPRCPTGRAAPRRAAQRRAARRARRASSRRRRTATTARRVPGDAAIALARRAPRRSSPRTTRRSRPRRANGGPSRRPSEWLLDNYYLIEEQVRTVRERPARGLRRRAAPADRGRAAPASRASTRLRVDARRAHRLAARRGVPRPLRRRRTRTSRRSPSARSGPSRSCCASRSSRTCAASRAASSRAHARRAARPTTGRTGCSRPRRTRPTRSPALLARARRAHRQAPTPPFFVRLAQRLRRPGARRRSRHRAGSSAGSPSRGDRRSRTVTQPSSSEQAANQVSIANAITSIRFLDALDWRGSSSACSLVEHVLREDPAGVYARMDFASRDRYRHALEELAQRCPLAEIEVAEAAVELRRRGARDATPTDLCAATSATTSSAAAATRFERALGYRPTPRERALPRPARAPRASSTGALLGVTDASLLARRSVAYALRRGRGAVGGRRSLVAARASCPLSELALDVVNRLAARRLAAARAARSSTTASPSPTRTARSSSCRRCSPRSRPPRARRSTTSRSHYLANRDPNVALRAARRPARPRDAEHAPGDARDHRGRARRHRRAQRALRRRARRAARSTCSSAARTLQRGRGHVDGLGAQARRAGRARARCCAAPRDTIVHRRRTATRRSCRASTFVITLDADTVLPRDGARKLISHHRAPAQPRALRRRDARGVARGYGLVQPRVGMSLPGSRRTPLRVAVLGADRASTRTPARSPTRTRTSSARAVHRQGHLRGRRLRRACSRAASPRTRCSPTT